MVGAYALVYNIIFALSVETTEDRRQLNVNNLIKALNEVFSDWETLGIRLDVKWTKIREIAKSRSHREPHLCLADLMDFWLGSDVDASWERVAMALEEMDKQDLARRIRSVYCSAGI